ncbi:MAG: TIGR02147 family protein [Fibrobacter sp.]|nr:TIGR02147 family protein [Fibrobacter sp.]
MPEVLDYLEYREFLKDWFVETKKDNPFTSYRYLGQKTGVDPAWLVRVFQKEGHLNEGTLPAFIRLCGLDDRRAEYFKTLYRFNKTKAKQALSELYYRLMELRSMETRVLSAPELSYFGSWACAALRALIGITKDTSDIGKLGKSLSPAISQDEARSALGILKQLGLVVPDGNGGWNITDQIISTGGEVKSQAVRDFHRHTLELAQESIDRHKPEDRDISSVVFTADEDDLPEIRHRIEEFRRGLLQFARKSERADRVYALNIAMFPLSDKVDDPDTGAAPQNRGA